MTKNVKVLLGVITLLVVIAVGVFAMNPDLGKGLMRVPKQSNQNIKNIKASDNLKEVPNSVPETKYTCGKNTAGKWTNIFNQGDDYYSESVEFSDHKSFVESTKNGYFEGAECPFQLEIFNNALTYNLRCNKLSYVENSGGDYVYCYYSDKYQYNVATAELRENGVRFSIHFQEPALSISNSGGSMDAGTEYKYMLREVPSMY